MLLCPPPPSIMCSSYFDYLKLMNELHNEYVKDDHFEQEDDEDENLQQLKGRTSVDQEGDSMDEDLEHDIMDQVRKAQQREDSISEDVELKLQRLLQGISTQNEEQVVKLRMSELALSKILVYTHGKNEFRLVVAHHHMGKAYLNYRCYEQAIDHLTLALKKNSKLAAVKQTKLYHTCILRALSKCYYEISSFEDALEVLSKAEDIQSTYYHDHPDPTNTLEERCDVDTLKLIANCHTRLKNYKKAHAYLERAMGYCRKAKGEKSVQWAKLKIDQAKNYYEEKEYPAAIQQLNSAIERLIELDYPNRVELIDLEELLAHYYEKSGDVDKQIDTLFSKLQLFAEEYDEAHKSTLKLKRSIVTVLMRHARHDAAVRLLEEILESEEKVYGPASMHVGKTLKMLGINFMQKENETNSAEHYLKRALKVLQEQGNAKLVKEVKAKLVALKDIKERRINGMIHQE